LRVGTDEPVGPKLAGLGAHLRPSDWRPVVRRDDPPADDGRAGRLIAALIPGDLIARRKLLLAPAALAESATLRTAARAAAATLPPLRDERRGRGEQPPA
jgi:hypothetical protein